MAKWFLQDQGKLFEIEDPLQKKIEQYYLQNLNLHNLQQVEINDDIKVNYSTLEISFIKKKTTFQLKRVCNHFISFGFSLVIVHNKKLNKFLAVNETKNRGWWVPGGKVEPPENFYQAAERETLEEGGINIKIEGILRVEYSNSGSNTQRMKVIFYAVPEDINQSVKTVPDSESLESRWLSIEEMESGSFKWRGRELIDWAKYINNNGQIFPLSILQEECAEIPKK